MAVSDIPVVVLIKELFHLIHSSCPATEVDKESGLAGTWLSVSVNPPDTASSAPVKVKECHIHVY